MSAHGRAGGFSLLELVVVISLAGLLAAVALDRYAEYQEQADRAAQRNIELSLKTSLVLQAAHIAQHEGASHLRRLEAQNPFDLLAEQPSSYLGALPADPAAVKPGHWYYDQAGKQVIYVRRVRKNWLEAGPVERMAYRVVVRQGTVGTEAVLLVPVSEGGDGSEN